MRIETDITPWRDFPDFFIIGAPKCGTTSLFSWLQAHPDTCLPIKEPNFLSPDVRDLRSEAGAITTKADYLMRLCPPEARGRLRGEATPKYLYSDVALRELTKQAQRTRLIVMLRNPVDLALALHAQNLRQGRERETDFMTAWEASRSVPGNRMQDYRFLAQPGRRLEAYLAAFPKERIKVMILEEEMRDNPQRAFDDVLAFLDLPSMDQAPLERLNRRQAFRSEMLQGAARRTRRASYRLMARLGIAPRGTGLLGVFDRLNTRSSGPAPATPEIRAQLAWELDEDAQRIARLLGRTSLPWDDFDWQPALAGGASG